MKRPSTATKREALGQIISFPANINPSGTLLMYQSGGNPSVPFPIRKVLFITPKNAQARRGAHTHHKTRQLLICLRGSCVVDLDDGTRERSIRLQGPGNALLLEPYVWHAMHTFSKGTELLVLASELYDETEYIRDYDSFRRIIDSKRR